MQITIAFYLLVCGSISIYFVLDVWSDQFLLLSKCFPDLNINSLDIATLKTISYTTAGSILGAVIISLRGLHIYGVIQRNFEMSYSGSYFIGPWASGLLGISVYALVRGGLLVFGGDSEIESLTQATQFGYFGLGFLIGFAWDKVLQKIDSIAAQLFGSENNEMNQGNAIQKTETEIEVEMQKKETTAMVSE